MYAIISSSLKALSTIRAYGAQVRVSMTQQPAWLLVAAALAAWPPSTCAGATASCIARVCLSLHTGALPRGAGAAAGRQQHLELCLCGVWQVSAALWLISRGGREGHFSSSRQRLDDKPACEAGDLHALTGSAGRTGANVKRLRIARHRTRSPAAPHPACLSRWIGFRLDLISAIVMLAAALVSAAARDQINPALLGLALSNLLQMTGIVQWFVRQSAEVRAACTAGAGAAGTAGANAPRARAAEALRAIFRNSGCCPAQRQERNGPRR